MSLNIDIEEWKKGIPQRELEQKIREYEEDYPKREKMTPQARENNQTRFFLEDRFYELHKQQLADMLKKQAEGNVLLVLGRIIRGLFLSRKIVLLRGMVFLSGADWRLRL